MKLLITGHKGYIGAWICKLAENNPQINLVGIDLNLFEGCEIEKLVQIPELEVTDIRKINSNMLNDIDVICHLAAISNDPMGELDSKITTDINLHGTLQLAELAKKAGVKKFIFSGSCSIYGSSADKEIDETGKMLPLSTYAKSKVESEAGLKKLADKNFQVISLRNATAFGWSPALRTDLVANNLCSSAICLGKQVVFSDGEPWRPLVHCRDIAEAFISFSLLERLNENFIAINIGSSNINVKVKNIVEIISNSLPETNAEFKNIAPDDPRNYRVSFEKLETMFTQNNPIKTDLKNGIVEMIQLMKKFHINDNIDFLSNRFIRLKTLQKNINKI